MPAKFPPPEMKLLLLYDYSGQWTDIEKDEVAVAHARLVEALSPFSFSIELFPVVDKNFSQRLTCYDPQKFLLFNWCDGIPGLHHSEYVVVRQIEQMGFVFTGSSSATLSLSYDKSMVKEILDRNYIPTPRWQLFRSMEPIYWNQFPAIVKPSFGHCSEWLTPESVVMNYQELQARISFIVEGIGQSAIVEDFIDGREFHVSMWGNGRVSMLPPVEMDFPAFSNVNHRLCTYDAKFVPGSAQYEGIRSILPSSLSESELAKLKSVCMSAYKTIMCRDYGRIDVRLRDGVFYVLDVNPNPDISEDASMASAAIHAGYTHGEMAVHLIKLACKRHPVFGKKFPHQDRIRPFI
jgi:D-alanine-D-alanine ligase